MPYPIGDNDCQSYTEDVMNTGWKVSATLLVICIIALPSQAQSQHGERSARPDGGSTSIGFVAGGLGAGVALSGRYSYSSLLVMLTGRFMWEDPRVPYNVSLDLESHQDYALLVGGQVRYGIASAHLAFGPSLATGTVLGAFRSTAVRTETYAVPLLFTTSYFTREIREDTYDTDRYSTFGAAAQLGIAFRVSNNFGLEVHVHAIENMRFSDRAVEIGMVMGTI
jgi:hypothetical protein